MDDTNDRVLITVTGRDRAGITATLTGILSEQGATLHDIEQVVVQGQLTLCLLVGLAHARDVLKDLLFAAKELGIQSKGTASVSSAKVLGELATLVAEGKVVITVAAKYALEQVREAFNELERGHTRGKIVLIP